MGAPQKVRRTPYGVPEVQKSVLGPTQRGIEELSPTWGFNRKSRLEWAYLIPNSTDKVNDWRFAK